MNSLFNNVLEKLNIHLTKDLKEINLNSVDQNGRSNFLNTEDIAKMLPRVKDYRYVRLNVLAKQTGADSYPYSVNLMMDMARKLDAEGKKSQWYMVGG